MSNNIKDNEGIKKLADQMKFMQYWLNLTDKEDQKGKYCNLKKEFLELSQLPDQYNDRFSQYGWVAHESLSPEVMKEAIVIFDNHDIEKTEIYLTDVYELELSRQLNRLTSNEIIRPRKK